MILGSELALFSLHNLQAPPKAHLNASSRASRYSRNNEWMKISSKKQRVFTFACFPARCQTTAIHTTQPLLGGTYTASSCYAVDAGYIRNIQRSQRNRLDAGSAFTTDVLAPRECGQQSVRQVVSRLDGANGSMAVIQRLCHASSMPSKGRRQTLVSGRFIVYVNPRKRISAVKIPKSVT